jgi:hypothetical protein
VGKWHRMLMLQSILSLLPFRGGLDVPRYRGAPGAVECCTKHSREGGEESPDEEGDVIAAVEGSEVAGVCGKQAARAGGGEAGEESQFVRSPLKFGFTNRRRLYEENHPQHEHDI